MATENDPDYKEEPLVSIPNHLMISSHHVKAHKFGSILSRSVNYSEAFDLAPEIFDPKYKYKPNSKMKSIVDNEFAEYFQITFFLITEKLRGE
jgi:hypothetical protein